MERFNVAYELLNSWADAALWERSRKSLLDLASPAAERCLPGQRTAGDPGLLQISPELRVETVRVSGQMQRVPQSNVSSIPVAAQEEGRDQK